jgi:nucleotide-binding universal stress UspA family protein
MYKKILVSLALDHGIGARALDTARELLDDDGEIIAIHVLDKIPEYAHQYLEADQDDKIKTKAMESVKESIGDAKDAEAVVVFGHAGQTIPEYAEKIGADCIIAGSHKPSLMDFFLGSTATRIVRHASCSVDVIR